MSIIQITDKKELNSLQSQKPMAQFLQSWEWGEFQKSVGRKVFRFGIEENGKLTSAITTIKHNLPFGKSYLYCPRIVTRNSELVTRELKKIAKQENSIFIKVEPVSKTLMPHLPRQQAGASCLMTKTKHIQPPTTLLLDLTSSKEEILSNMHQKTRYNIRLAEKKGVKIKESDNIEEFLKLNAETTARDKFKSHSDDYYQKMYKVLGANQQCNNVTMKPCRLAIFTAYYKNQPIASNIIIFSGDTATYLHGASGNEHRNLMAPHLLQWEAIKYAKQEGYKWYDFWGINPSKNLKIKKSWQGITRFKQGFVSEKTGKEINYPPCLDLPVSRFWYTLYKVVKPLKN